MSTKNLDQFLDGVYKFIAEINEQAYMKENPIPLSEKRENFDELKEKLKKINADSLRYVGLTDEQLFFKLGVFDKCYRKCKEAIFSKLSVKKIIDLVKIVINSVKAVLDEFGKLICEGIVELLDISAILMSEEA